MRTIYCPNGEQVSRTVLTLCFQLVSRGPPGSWHAAVSARAILAYFQVALSNQDLEEVYTASVIRRFAPWNEDWEEVLYSLGQSKITAHAVEWRRVLSLATHGSAHNYLI